MRVVKYKLSYHKISDLVIVQDCKKMIWQCCLPVAPIDAFVKYALSVLHTRTHNLKTSSISYKYIFYTLKYFKTMLDMQVIIFSGTNDEQLLMLLYEQWTVTFTIIHKSRYCPNSFHHDISMKNSFPFRENLMLCSYCFSALIAIIRCWSINPQIAKLFIKLFFYKENNFSFKFSSILCSYPYYKRKL